MIKDKIKETINKMKLGIKYITNYIYIGDKTSIYGIKITTRPGETSDEILNKLTRIDKDKRFTYWKKSKYIIIGLRVRDIQDIKGTTLGICRIIKESGINKYIEAQDIEFMRIKLRR